MRKASIVKFLAALSLMLIAVVPVSVLASSAGSNSSGIKVFPIRTDLTIDQGKQTTVNITLQNLTSAKATFAAQVDNFSSYNLKGIPNIIVNSKSNDQHSIQPFIGPIKNFTVGADQASTVNIPIKVPADTSGGGYYGAIRFIEISSSSEKTVNIDVSVASLILITVPGPQLNQDLALSTFNVDQNNQPGRLFFSNRNLSVNSIFTNDGNVQVEPFGKLTIENMSGKVIKTLSINKSIPPGNVLPNSSRQFTVNISGLSAPGEYKAVGAYGYGDQGRLLTASVTFYVIPAWLVIVLALTIVLIVLGIVFTPKFFRWWYRRSIKRGR